MRLRVLNSGSKANGYILYNDTEALIIECGVPYSTCLNALDFKRDKIVGALISHEHGDHSKYVNQYLDGAVNVFASQGTIDGMAIKSRLKVPTPLTEKEVVDVGRFKVLGFRTQHDCKEPFGFLVYHEDMGTLLFATDTYYVKYKFGGLNHIMLECNYDTTILNRNVEAGIVHAKVRDRVMLSHMSLATHLATLKANDISEVRNIVMLHLSADNSDGELFKNEVAKATGKLVTVAMKGVDIALN